MGLYPIFILYNLQMTTKDLKDFWEILAHKYDGLTYEILDKPYPNSITQGAKIVRSMRLLVNYKWWQLTTWRLDYWCNDNIFKMHVEDLENNIIDLKINWKITSKELDLPF